MRVLMSAGVYDIGGSSTVMEKLANKLVENGHDVTIGALWFRRFPRHGFYDAVRIPIDNVWKLSRFLESFDIIHSHHAITNYLALVCRKPFIYHYHGAPDLGRDYLYKASVLFSIKITSHRFDAVIAVSESGVAELKKNFDLGNVNIVYNGVDTSLFKPGLEEKFRKGTPQFLFVGNLHEHKNVEELIFSFKMILKDYPKACLQIVGNGSMYERLKNLVTEIGLENNVELAGRVSNFEIPYYYASCDVYVTASRWELFGLPLLEAMACGKPVVASSIPSHVELLTKSKAGEIYPVGNVESLRNKMIKTCEKNEKYRDNAIIFAKKHDWSVVADRLSRIYAQILGN
jgi:glycosyltransferase involved in cell wall biosynthesis